jgi:hypothetical protein
MPGETFTPKRILLRGDLVETVNLATMIDGSVDINMSPEMVMTGMATRRLAADPPGAFIFVCHCGWKRRVVHTETNFRCERGGVGPECKCDIMWFRKQRKTEEVNSQGQPIYEDETTMETLEMVDEFSGKPSKRKVAVPVFIGRKVGEVRAEEMKRRAAAGEEQVAHPNDVVSLRQVGGAKPEVKK